MRIAFIAISLKPGFDGVGDYTRQLSGELIRRGHPCSILGLNDAHVLEELFDYQEIAGTRVPVLRLSKALPWRKRVKMARKWLEEFKPDWVSLQFLSFGFHPKGLCFGLGARLALINRTAPWHVMVHEPWLGLDENSPVKYRIWGAMQKWIIKDLVNSLRPKVVHTHAAVYRSALSQERIKASILPMFGNIPQASTDDSLEIMSSLTKVSAGNLTSSLLVGVFGTIPPEWDPEAALASLHSYAQARQKSVILIAFGRCGPHGVNILHRLRLRWAQRLAVIELGFIDTKGTAAILSSLNVALATTPWTLADKSSTIAAFIDFGVPTVVTRDDVQYANADCAPHNPLVEKYKGGETDWEKVLEKRTTPKFRLPEIAELLQIALDNKL
jgi:hypothetical protein